MQSPPFPPRLPWRDGNLFRLLPDGDRFFPAFLEAMDEARRFIWLELYLFESGRAAGEFISRLERARERGVSVHLLLDHFGAHGLVGADRDRLRASGIELAFYNPLSYGRLRRNLFRDHRKILVVDGEVAFTGGFGVTDEFYAPGDPLAWRETAVEIRGPLVADWQALFRANWSRWSDTLLPEPPSPPPSLPGGVRGRVTVSPPRKGQTGVKRSFQARVRHARERIYLATAYFVPSRRLRRHLMRAARRGVDVRLLLPGRHTDHPAVRLAGRRFYDRLLRAGVRIYEYQPRFLHQKVILCDDWASIGSSNLDRWNLRWNLEANQEVRDPAFAAEVKQMLETDLAESLEISPYPWARRTWGERLGEWFFGHLDRWLDRWLR
ncbi:MAG TPA: phosphatidylserine/phosphatidylglycerophosphate/cardiolipin synthase family protein [Thiotrichales bacterium]|nr:phosphatidylserine/phosphatidylglycerophosphate/cardiolipin synthase family protein [Thiotrichales bacterium]